MSVIEAYHNGSSKCTHNSSRLLFRGAGGTLSTHFSPDRAHLPHGYSLSHFTLREKQRSQENLTTGRFWAMTTARSPERGPKSPPRGLLSPLHP